MTVELYAYVMLGDDGKVIAIGSFTGSPCVAGDRDEARRMVRMVRGSTIAGQMGQMRLYHFTDGVVVDEAQFLG